MRWNRVSRVEWPKQSPDPLQHSCPAPAVWSYRRRTWRVAPPGARPEEGRPRVPWPPPSPSRNSWPSPAPSGPSARCRPWAASPTCWAAARPRRQCRPRGCTAATRPSRSAARMTTHPPKPPRSGTNTTPTRLACLRQRTRPISDWHYPKNRTTVHRPRPVSLGLTDVFWMFKSRKYPKCSF